MKHATGFIHTMLFLELILVNFQANPPTIFAQWSQCHLTSTKKKFNKNAYHHLIFSIWATTQHYADFDVQVRTVLGPQRAGAGRFHDASRFLNQLYLTGLQPDAE